MSQQEHKSKKDLDGGFMWQAERHWREYRPKLYQYLKEKGILYDELYEAGRQAEEYMQEQEARPGFNLATDYHAAKEVALRTWIYLPDVYDETDEPDRVIPD